MFGKGLDSAKQKRSFDFSRNSIKIRSVISSKFPKSFRGAGDLVVFYEFFSDFSG